MLPEEENVSMPNPCQFTPTPTNPNCSFRGTAGTQVTVEVKDIAGSVDFATAKYNGTDIPGTPAKSITFTLAAGSHDLEVVYTFTDPVAGRGELREVCDANTFLKEVRAANKAVAYTICA
jgi:hypothetical protein